MEIAMNDPVQTEMQPKPDSRRLVIGSIFFAVFWSLGMIWWSGDYRVANFVMFAITGSLVGLAWFWWMKRFMLRQAQK
jgi:hypothetical protein